MNAGAALKNSDQRRSDFSDVVQPSINSLSDLSTSAARKMNLKLWLVERLYRTGSECLDWPDSTD